MTQANRKKACFCNSQKMLERVPWTHQDLGIGFSLCHIMTLIEKLINKNFDPMGKEETWLLEGRSVGHIEHSKIH